MTSKTNRYFENESIRENLRALTVRSAGATIFSQGAIFLVQLLSTAIIARILTPEDFGVVAMVLSIFVFFRIIRNFGLTDATIQKEKINHEDTSTLFWVNIFFGFFLTVLFILLGPLISLFYGEPRLVSIAAIISLDFFFGGASAQHRALMKRNFQFYRSSFNDFFAMAASFTVAIVMALKGFGYWSLVFRHMLNAVFEALGAWVLCSWVPGKPRFHKGVLSSLKFGRDMLKNYTLNYFTQNLDKILIGWRNGAQSLGYYNRAYFLFLAPAQQLSMPLVNVATASLSRLTGEPEKFRVYYLNAFQILCIVGMFISATLTLLSTDIVLLLLGPQWGRTSQLLSILSLGIGVQMLYSTNTWLHVSLGRPDRWFRWNVFGTCVMVTAYFIGLPFGTGGIATAYILSLFILIIPGIHYAGKPVELGFRAVALPLARFLASGLLAGFASWALLFKTSVFHRHYANWHIIVRLAAGTLICLIFYITAVILVHGGTGPLRNFLKVAAEMVPGRKTTG